MADKANVASTDTKVEQEAKPEIKEQTLESVITDKKEKDVVPLSKFMEERTENKQLKARIKQLEDQKDPVTKDDLEELAEEFNASPELLKALDKRYRGSAKSTEDSDIKQELEEIKAERKGEKLDKIFDGLWDKALSIEPELMAVADKETLKKLALLPENQELTLTQLAEKTYAKVNLGKRTIESSKPGAREKGTEDVNFAKMSDEDWETVNQSPELKKKYDDYLLGSIRF